MSSLTRKPANSSAERYKKDIKRYKKDLKSSIQEKKQMVCRMKPIKPIANISYSEYNRISPNKLFNRSLVIRKLE